MAYSKSANKAKGNWNQQLHEFVRDLVPSQDDVKKTNKLADKIFRILQEEQNQYKIDRRVIAGSLGKKTAISGGDIGFDVDLVVMVNDISVKDFPKVLECFEKALDAKGISCRIPTSGVALTTKIDDFDFDIVPAINFSQSEDEQNRSVQEEMKKSPMTDRYRLSSSLVFAHLKFIKSQSAFVHDVIRLCKFWNKRCPVDKYISGRSSLFELIAVDVANKVENSGKGSLYTAFRQFLEALKNFDNMNIKFDVDEDEPKFPPRKAVYDQRPLVLDPYNPFNNFAYGIMKNKAAQQIFVEEASKDLSSLDELGDRVDLPRLKLDYTTAN